MSTYVSYRDGGKTNEEGLFKWFSRLFTTGFPLTYSSTSMQAVQRGAGANMSVDVSIGDLSLPDTAGSGYNLYSWNDAASNAVVSAADPTNPRVDVVYAYIDLSVVQSVTSNNPGALKFGVYAGTPAGSPTTPSDATIQAALGATTPFVAIANIAVAASATQVVTANITDRRTPIALRARLWGGASNTIGHLIPNIADDTVALLNAAQTFLNKTFTSPTLNTPSITGWDGWQLLSVAPNTVTHNGNRSYDLVFNSTDLTSLVSAGMRLRTTRTVAAPTQCTDLESTSSQFWNKATPTGMAQTDDITCMGWIKLESYTGVSQTIMSRINGTTDGWTFELNSGGQLVIKGARAADDIATSYQSIPLGRWVHVAATLDSSGAASTMYIDGISVPVAYTNNANTAFAAGTVDFRVGAGTGGTLFFDGKIAQAAYYSAVLSAATIKAAMNQTLAGNETSNVGTWNFNGNANDSNANANNLSANGSAAATATDSPFGGQADGTVSSTKDYAIVMKASFSTNTTLTIHVPEGCTVPTSGGVSAVSSSALKTPYGFPGQRLKWLVFSKYKVTLQTTINTTTAQMTGYQLSSLPVGLWKLTHKGFHELRQSSTAFANAIIGLSTATGSFSSDLEDTKMETVNTNVATSELDSYAHTTANYEATAMANLYGIALTSINMTVSYCNGASTIPNIIEAENAYL